MAEKVGNPVTQGLADAMGRGGLFEPQPAIAHGLGVVFDEDGVPVECDIPEEECEQEPELERLWREMDEARREQADEEPPKERQAVTVSAWSDGDPAQAAVVADRMVALRRVAMEKLRAERRSYDARKADLDRWWEEREHAILRDARFAELMLEGYHEDFFADTRTVTLPGDVKITRAEQKPKKVWSDLKAAEAHQLKNYPQEMSRTLAKIELNEHLTLQPDGGFFDSSTGEVVEFVRMVKPEVSHTWSIKDPLDQ